MNPIRPAQRLFDIVLSGAALAVLFPVLLISAIGVRVTSSGPVLYRAARVGQGGGTFTMFKLRTMHSGAGNGPKITAPGDHRITPIGRFLRKAKIDELPQLVNILIGDMSIVGPRPEDPDIVEKLYGPAEHLTLGVRPGLTSPGTIWYYEKGEDQLEGDDALRKYEGVMRHKLRIDAEYLKSATIITDVWVILQTCAAVVRRIVLNRHAKPIIRGLKH